MTPTRKGLYKECVKCIYKEITGKKYPCEQSHKSVRKASGEYYERNFKNCGLFKQE